MTSWSLTDLSALGIHWVLSSGKRMRERRWIRYVITLKPPSLSRSPPLLSFCSSTPTESTSCCRASSGRRTNERSNSLSLSKSCVCVSEPTVRSRQIFFRCETIMMWSVLYYVVAKWNLYSVSWSKRVLKVVPRIPVIRDGTKIQNGCWNQCGGSSSVERPQSTREYQPNLISVFFVLKHS